MLTILVMTMMNSLKRHSTCRIPCEAGKTASQHKFLALASFGHSLRHVLRHHCHFTTIPLATRGAFRSQSPENLQLLGKFKKLLQQTEHLAIIALPISYSSSSSWTKVQKSPYRDASQSHNEGLGWDSRC